MICLDVQYMIHAVPSIRRDESSGGMSDACERSSRCASPNNESPKRNHMAHALTAIHVPLLISESWPTACRARRRSVKLCAWWLAAGRAVRATFLFESDMQPLQKRCWSDAISRRMSGPDAAYNYGTFQRPRFCGADNISAQMGHGRENLICRSRARWASSGLTNLRSTRPESSCVDSILITR